MKSIWKYPISVIDTQKVLMPKGARALCVQHQPDVPMPPGSPMTLWVLVDPDADLEEREILIFGTGHPMPDPQGEYVGTQQQGGLVWHVFVR